METAAYCGTVQLKKGPSLHDKDHYTELRNQESQERFSKKVVTPAAAHCANTHTRAHTVLTPMRV